MHSSQYKRNKSALEQFIFISQYNWMGNTESFDLIHSPQMQHIFNNSNSIARAINESTHTSQHNVVRRQSCPVVVSYIVYQFALNCEWTHQNGIRHGTNTVNITIGKNPFEFHLNLLTERMEKKEPIACSYIFDGRRRLLHTLLRLLVTAIAYCAALWLSCLGAGVNANCRQTADQIRQQQAQCWE